jgi:hypothetical protein
VPLGALVSLLAGVVLARSFYVPFLQRRLEQVYGHPSSPAEWARLEAELPTATRDALQLQLSLAGMAVTLLSVALGGFVVGRFGANTNARHGTLAGITAVTLMVLFLGRSLTGTQLFAYLLLIPFGGLVGYLGGLAGTVLKPR